MKIVILDGQACNPGDLDWQAFERLGDVTVYDNTPQDQVVQRIGDAPVVIVNKVLMTKQVIDSCPNLRYIGLTATGYNVVDIEAARQHGIPVCNVPAYSSEAVAQHVFALLLEVSNRVGIHDRAVQSGKWIKSPNFCFWDAPLMELNGKTLGIIGYGQIGQQVAKIAQAFGMRVIATAHHMRPGLVSLQEVLRESDVISLHCPLFADNREMINRESIASMKDGVIIINTARGGLINEADLRQALAAGKVGAACVDVVSVEPMLPDNPLLGAPNCLITPHIAWAPAETRRRLLGIAADNIRSFIEGQVKNDVTAK